jgi:hypothetical protein
MSARSLSAAERTAPLPVVDLREQGDRNVLPEPPRPRVRALPYSVEGQACPETHYALRNTGRPLCAAPHRYVNFVYKPGKVCMACFAEASRMGAVVE